jgi:membrane-associated phospholipid phosphatase
MSSVRAATTAASPHVQRRDSAGITIRSWRLPLLAVLLLMAAVAVVPADCWVARHLAESAWPRGTSELRKLIHLAEVFASGVGVIAILITAALLDRRGWRIVPRLALLSLGSGLMADVGKLMLARARPRIFDLSQSGWDSFGVWLPTLLSNPESQLGSNWQAMPSAHTATAMGLAIGLSRLYPQARNWFFFLVVLAGLQRILVSAHYPSDVLVGAALGLFFAAACQRMGRFSTWLERLEK